VSALGCRAVQLISTAVMAALFVLLALNWGRSEEKFRLPALFHSAEGDRRVILLIVDRLSYAEIASRAGPVLQSLFKEEVISLMNVRSGRLNSESAYLSLGSGARAAAGFEGGMAFSRNELVDRFAAQIIFQRNTGSRPAGEVFHLHAQTLQEENLALPYPVTVGLLGQTLSAAGMKTAVVGHADAAENPGRSAVMIAMDSLGQVSLGEAGLNVVAEEPLFPFGMRTDAELFAAVAARYLQQAQLVVADFGDLSRLDQYWEQLSPQRRDEIFSAAMGDLDHILSKLLPLLKEGHLLLMVTPSPPRHRPDGGEQLTPFLMASPNGLGPALLSSPATRRQGLITNTDLAAMIYAYLAEGALVAGNGRAMGIASGLDQAGYLHDFSIHSRWVHRFRPPVIQGYILVLILVLLTVMTGLIFRLSWVKRLFFLLEGLMLFPLTLLLLPVLTRAPLAYIPTALLIIGVTLLLLLILCPLKRMGRSRLWSAIGLLTALSLIVDTITGARLQQASILGYDPIGGARYFGVGNEYMGVLIGSLIMGTVTLTGIAAPASVISPQAEKSSGVPAARLNPLSLAILPAYIMVLLVMASPRFGANLGGTLSAAVALGLAWAGLSGLLDRKRLLPLAATLCIFLIFALTLLWVFNMRQQSPVTSHLGDFGAMMGDRGLEVFWETAQRKIQMNLRLIRYSVWSRAFVTLVGLLVVLIFYPVGILKRLKKEQPHLVICAVAALAGAVTALLTNDSGVVAAALVLLYVAPPVLITIVGKTLTAPGSHCR